MRNLKPKQVFCGACLAMHEQYINADVLIPKMHFQVYQFKSLAINPSVTRKEYFRRTKDKIYF